METGPEERTVDSKTSWLAALLVALLLAAPARAADLATPHGASTLPGRTAAFGMDFGLDYPDPLGAALRFDYGVTDRFQVGVSASSLLLLATVTGHTKLGVLRSADDAHSVSVEGSLGYLRSWQLLWGSRNVDALTARTGLGYELRPWSSRRTGLFAKAGSVHIVADNEIDFDELEEEKSGHAARFTAGIQHQFGDSFTLHLQGSVHVPGAQPTARLGLTWAF